MTHFSTYDRQRCQHEIDELTATALLKDWVSECFEYNVVLNSVSVIWRPCILGTGRIFTAVLSLIEWKKHCRVSHTLEFFRSSCSGSSRLTAASERVLCPSSPGWCFPQLYFCLTQLLTASHCHTHNTVSDFCVTYSIPSSEILKSPRFEKTRQYFLKRVRSSCHGLPLFSFTARENYASIINQSFGEYFVSCLDIGFARYHCSMNVGQETAPPRVTSKTNRSSGKSGRIHWIVTAARGVPTRTNSFLQVASGNIDNRYTPSPIRWIFGSLVSRLNQLEESYSIDHTDNLEI